MRLIFHSGNCCYEYHKAYGSKQFDLQPVAVKAVTLSPDRKKVSLTLASIKLGLIYELTLGLIKAANGEPLTNKLICYTINKVKKLTN